MTVLANVRRIAPSSGRDNTFHSTFLSELRIYVYQLFGNIHKCWEITRKVLASRLRFAIVPL
jgi:hypothetical protein